MVSPGRRTRSTGVDIVWANPADRGIAKRPTQSAAAVIVRVICPPPSRTPPDRPKAMRGRRMHFPTKLVERRTSLRSVGDAGTAYLFPGRENKGHMFVAGHYAWHRRRLQPRLLDAEVGHPTQNLLKQDPKFEPDHIGGHAAVAAQA